MLPPLPELPSEVQRPSSGVTLFVSEIRFEGNQVFTNEELQRVAAPYEDRTLAAEELLELRDRLTRKYVEAGYVNSGAVIPDQEVRQGVITIRIIEGQIEQVAVRGLQILRPSFLEDRIRASAEPVLNVIDLQDELQLLLAEAIIDRVDAQLGPGSERGQSRLDVEIVEAPRLTGALQLDNNRSPSVGELQGEVEVVARSVAGLNDPAFARLDVTEGLRDIALGYSVPLNADDLRLRLFGEYISSEVVERPFDALNVESDSWTFEVGLRQPVIRSLDEELGLGIDFVRRSSRTTLLGDPFPIARDGESDITAFRFVGDYLARSQEQVLALRSTVSLGIDALGATKDVPGFDDSGQFLAWLGQGQYARRFDARGDQVLFRVDLQLAADPILPLEQIAIGGLNSVRGYRRNELVRDSGVVASVESRVPLIDLPIPGVTGPNDRPALELASFADFGHGWDHSDRGASQRDAETISSVGIGLLWSPSSRIAARFYYGYALNELPEPFDESLQDHGIHFEVRVVPF